MSDTRLPDCSPPRTHDGTTRASAHPELINGELALQPRLHRMTAHDPKAFRRASRIGMLCILIFVGMAAHSTFMRHHFVANAQSTEARGQGEFLCSQWHQAASAVVARLAESTRDSDLRQINDAVFRIRRALRNCGAGWLALACQDYHSVAQGLPAGINMSAESMFDCHRWSATSSPTTKR